VVLPTIRKFDLGIKNLTPLEKYRSLLKAISKVHGINHNYE